MSNKKNLAAIRYYNNHREICLEKERKYRFRNRDKILKKLNKYRGSIRGKYSRYKGSVKEKGIGFEITLKEFESFWGKSCYYCGDLIETIGLDRIDSEQGYRIENIVSCCSDCNYMKLRKTPEAFIDRCKKISSWWSADNLKI